MTNKKEIIKNLLNNQAQKTQELVYETDAGNLTIKVEPVIPFSKRSEMIGMITGMVFNDEETIDGYMPMFIEVAKRYATVNYFTDFELPKKVDDIWLILTQTKIYEDVAKIVGNDLNEIFNEAEQMIKAKVDYLTHKSDLNKFMNKFINGINDFSKQIGDADIDKLISALGNIPELKNSEILKSILKARIDVPNNSNKD